jgi:hypothetical protein
MSRWVNLCLVIVLVECHSATSCEAVSVYAAVLVYLHSMFILSVHVSHAHLAFVVIQATGKDCPMSQREHYRSDGVRIQHDPYAKGMADKYGKPGETDNDGFDPYAGCACGCEEIKAFSLSLYAPVCPLRSLDFSSQSADWCYAHMRCLHVPLQIRWAQAYTAAG